MTYCVAVKCETGLVFLSDSRTNAGVDQVGTFRKMHVFEVPGERVMVLLTAGNLGISQSIASGLRAHMAKPGERSARSAVQDFPLGIGGLALFAGYAVAALSRAKRYDPDYVAFVQKKQRERLSLRHLQSFFRAISRPSASRSA